jgi:hypothetical protein
VTEPVSGAISPVIWLKSVVLPAPFGPIMRRRSPGSMTRSTPSVTRRPPNEAYRAGHQALRHEADDEDENQAQHQVPALDVGARHILHHDDDSRARDRPEQGRGASGDDHQQDLGRRRERRGRRGDELVVIGVEQPRNTAPEPRDQEGQEADQPHVEAQRRHARRLVAGAGEAGAERRPREGPHGQQDRQEDREGRVVERLRACERQPEGCGPARQVDAIVAVGEAGPAVGDAPHDLAQRQRDHQEADAGGPQRQQGEDRRSGERHADGGEAGDEVAGARLQHEPHRVCRHGQQPGMAEGDEAGVADEDIECQRCHRPQQDLAGDVDVERVMPEPDRQCQEQRNAQQRSRGGAGRSSDAPGHVVTLPNRPCGRSTRISTIGRNRMT